ncbi:MAG: GNAT family N-acetyltransferase [Candidatus Dojkabacteria bacterium]|nr:GNAT family N-acetyltransferase [Candidatus Dojkabacteria bacterium]
MKIKRLRTKAKAKEVGDFMISKNTFDQTWAPEEKKYVSKAPLESLENPFHQYWYFEDKGKIVAALGIRKNKYGSNGYEMDSDYVAVHKNYRRKGLASRLLKTAENFVKKHRGRYLHILTCDIPSYTPARTFFVKNGYEQVGKIPDYYVPGEGRIDFMKIFRKR